MCDSKEIFEGEHTRKTKQQAISTDFGIGKFMKSAKTCLNCRLEIKDRSWTKAVCENCDGQESTAYIKKMIELKSSEVEFSRYWAECQRCDGSLFNEVKCTNSDCPIFFKRQKMRKDVQNNWNQLEKFSINF